MIHTKRDTLDTSGNNAAHAVKFARLATSYAIELGKGELGPPPSAAAVAAGAEHGEDRAPLVAVLLALLVFAGWAIGRSSSVLHVRD